MLKDYVTSAGALYDGGWRSEEREELKETYCLTDDEVNRLCFELEKIDVRVKNQEKGIY